MSITNDATHDFPSPVSEEGAPSHNAPPSAGSARRTNYQMVGGILIPNEEGVRWFEKTYGRELRKDHRQDASVRMELERILTEVEGEPFGVEYVPRRDAPWYDFLAATQWEKGIWEHDNTDYIDEVLQPEQQMKGHSAREEQMRVILGKLGTIMSMSVPNAAICAARKKMLLGLASEINQWDLFIRISVQALRVSPEDAFGQHVPLSAYLFQLGVYPDALSLCEKWFNPQNPPELGGTAFDPPHRDMIA
ncbi:hypothetical protein B0H11DRAFT_2196505 [Mycena galericulata]|nr:hypothetical protein B0H11DRAFT_2196505 [Mycena galericulata]